MLQFLCKWTARYTVGTLSFGRESSRKSLIPFFLKKKNKRWRHSRFRQLRRYLLHYIRHENEKRGARAIFLREHAIRQKEKKRVLHSFISVRFSKNMPRIRNRQCRLLLFEIQPSVVAFQQMRSIKKKKKMFGLNYLVTFF